jgi:hypothetical protein
LGRGQKGSFEVETVTNTILVRDRAVDQVTVLPEAEAEERHKAAREALTQADGELARLTEAMRQAHGLVSGIRGEHLAALAEGADIQINILLGSTSSLDDVVTKYSQTGARLAIANAALQKLTEYSVPLARAQQLQCQISLKAAAADVIDSQRWARYEQHTATLDAMAAEEGALEIKPARFVEEGELANRMREEAAAIRRQLQEHLKHSTGLRAAARG